MNKEEVLKSVGKLVKDINHWTGELVVARGKRDEDGISYAHWAMESLIVAAHQELTFLANYVQEHIHDDEEIEAAFKHVDEVQYQNGYEKGYNDALDKMPHWRSLTERSCDGECPFLVVGEHGYVILSAVKPSDTYLLLSELEKLPTMSLEEIYRENE